MSGRDVKPRLPRMPGRPRPSLIAAAQSQPGPETTVAAAAAEAMDVDAPESKPVIPPAASTSAVAGPSTSAGTTSAAPIPVLSRSNTGTSDPSGRSTPAAGDAPPPAVPIPSASLSKMKFKPKMPVRRAVQEDVKPDISSASQRGRPSQRARGRGAGANRGGRPQTANNTIAAGPFGGSRANSTRRLVAPPPPPRYQPDASNIEVYSDNEDGSRPGVIDIEGVSALSESAPTSVYRERDLDGGKAKAKEMEKAKLKDLKKRRKAERAARAAAMAAAAGAGAGPEVHGSELLGVKAEPVSPVRPGAVLPDPNAGVPPPLTRVGDEMIPADESQDRDADGRRVRALTTGTDFTDGTPESQEVNAAHAVDLSESESEDEEDDMEGDFVFVEGMGNPEDKLFTFQFPSNMPKFVAPAPPAVPADADGDVNMAAELKPEVKPSPAQLRRRKHNAALPPPEGRIGTLVVMKSGKVKMVMGEGANAIVMNVTPGVPTTFLQQLVHLDQKHKNTTVLGEVHKQYTVTPDLDRLLEELFLNDGETPGDRERKQAELERKLRIERGLVKMEMSSP